MEMDVVLFGDGDGCGPVFYLGLKLIVPALGILLMVQINILGMLFEN